MWLGYVGWLEPLGKPISPVMGTRLGRFGGITYPFAALLASFLG
jgi:hypothetical protein